MYAAAIGCRAGRQGRRSFALQPLGRRRYGRKDEADTLPWGTNTDFAASGGRQPAFLGSKSRPFGRGRGSSRCNSLRSIARGPRGPRARKVSHVLSHKSSRVRRGQRWGRVGSVKAHVRCPTSETAVTPPTLLREQLARRNLPVRPAPRWQEVLNCGCVARANLRTRPVESSHIDCGDCARSRRSAHYVRAVRICNPCRTPEQALRKCCRQVGCPSRLCSKTSRPLNCRTCERRRGVSTLSRAVNAARGAR